VGRVEGMGEGLRVTSEDITALLSEKAMPRLIDAFVSTSARLVLTAEAKDVPSLNPKLVREAMISKVIDHV